MVTRLPRMALGIWCADCAPVLLADADAGVIGACHAGWRGALAGIVDAIVRAMVREGARPNRIAAAIGPCIGFASYEVSEDFAEPFLRQNPENIRFFAAAAKAPKLRFDLPGYLGQALKAAGIGQVEILGFDTLADPERFFSFRRATLTGEPSAGRQLSAIALAAPWG
jgi:YfiH family protein